MMTTVALALLESAQAFTAPAMRAPARSTAVTMFEEGDIGVLPPLGVYDPLGHARLPPRHPPRGWRPLPGLPVRLCGAQVHRHAQGLLRLARGGAGARLAPDPGGRPRVRDRLRRPRLLGRQADGRPRAGRHWRRGLGAVRRPGRE